MSDTTSNLEAMTADEINSIFQIVINPSRIVTTGKNDDAKKAILDAAPPEDRDELAKIFNSSGRFLPTANTCLGELRSLNNAMIKEMVSADDGRNYDGLEKTGRAKTYIGQLKDYDRALEIFDTYSPQIGACVSKIRSEWESLKEQGRLEMKQYGDGFEFPEVEDFLANSDASFEIDTVITDQKILNSALAEQAARLNARHKADKDRQIREIAGRQIKLILDQFKACEQRLREAGTVVDGKRKRLKKNNFENTLDAAANAKKKNFANIPEVEVAAATAASIIKDVDNLPDNPAERADMADEINKAHTALSSKMAAAGLL